MDASKIIQLLQKQNTKYINRCQTVDSSTLIWKNQIQSSKYIKGVKTCEGEQNWNVPTNPGCPVGNGICSFGGAGRTSAIQNGNPQQFLNVLSGAAGSAAEVYSSERILLQKAGKESCGVPGVNPAPENSYVVLPTCYCVNTNGPTTEAPSTELQNPSPLPINNQTNPYLPAFDTYYAMKNPSARCQYPIQDQNQKHFVKECHTRFPNANNGINAVCNPCDNTTYMDPNTKQFHTQPYFGQTNPDGSVNPIPPTCNGCVLENISQQQTQTPTPPPPVPPETLWRILGNSSSDIVGGQVYAIAIYGNDVYVGGDFTSAGGVANTSRIAKWDGTSWSALGTGMNGAVLSLAISTDGTSLYAGGGFSLASGVANTSRIARWNGTTWSPLGTGMDTGNVWALALSSDNSVLYAGGNFNSAGGVANTLRIAGCNNPSTSPSWFELNGGSTGTVVYSLALALDGSLYVGGSFASVGGFSPVANTRNIAKWINGTGWSALGRGTSTSAGIVYSLIINGNVLYAGGAFDAMLDSLGAIVTNTVRIALWNISGSSWSPLGIGIDSTGGTSVRALTIYNSNLYVGGSFTSAGNTVAGDTSASNIAIWNGTLWSALGSGTNTTINSLAIGQQGLYTYLYAGGNFSIAGGIAANDIATYGPI